MLTIEGMIAMECERWKTITGKGENAETRRGRNLIPGKLAIKILAPLSVWPLHVLRESAYLQHGHLAMLPILKVLPTQRTLDQSEERVPCAYIPNQPHT